MPPFCDLHIHTYYSDSTFSPEQVVEEAHNKGLGCIAITDHDTLEGVFPTITAAKKYDLEVITGIELSCEFRGKDIHLLAYLPGYEDSELQKRITSFQDSRVLRMTEMIERLKDLGMGGITLEEVCALTKSRSVGRPHLAKVMVEKGYVPNLKAAFDKYLADDGPAYVGKFKLTPAEAIALVRQSGGVSVLAHPMVTNCDELIPQFVNAGLQGLEVYYPNVITQVTDFYKGLAQKYNLLMTGGSDAHGKAKSYTYVGKTVVPYATVDLMKARATGLVR